MKKILGLDLGTNSIGWAVVNQADQPGEQSGIIDMGVRVNPLTTDESQNFEKGKPITTTAARTLKHGMRINLQRYKLRRDHLIAIFKREGFISDDDLLSECGAGSTFQTYRLRSTAATSEISLKNLARVLLAINKKRGYKSNRKIDKDSKGDEGQLIDSMDVAKKLYDEHLTPGQYVYEYVVKRNKKFIPDFYPSDLNSEFDEVWRVQSKFHPNILTEEFKQKLAGKGRNDVAKTFYAVHKVNTAEEKKRELRMAFYYGLRSRALTQELTIEEVAAVLAAINGDLAKSSGYLGSISDHSKELVFSHCTVGQYLMRQLEQNPHFRVKKRVYYRQDYLNEFETIWETQAKFHKELTPELKDEIRDTVIFYQRRLKSKKGLISVCELEGKKITIIKNGQQRHILVGPKVCPKSSPLFQEFKVWSTVNAIRISSKSGNDASGPLTDEQRQKLHYELTYCDKMSKTDIVKVLRLNPKTQTINYDSIQGNTTICALVNACKQILLMSGHDVEDFDKRTAKEKTDFISSVFREALKAKNDFDFLKFDTNLLDQMQSEPLFRLWHLLYSFEGDGTASGNDRLAGHIKEMTGLDDRYSKVIAGVSFADDYGNLSSKAIARILPYLEQGHVYSEACNLAGYRHSKASITKEENDSRELLKRLEILPKNALRNPVVEKIINQMIHVVNGCSEMYGEFDEIHIELARELKRTIEQRKEDYKRIGERTKETEEIKKLLMQPPFNLPHPPTRKDVIRYRLYEELQPNGYKTLYSNTYISREELFSPDRKFDIEHIIPQSRLFDDSYSNKTLESRQVNEAKSNMTAIDYVRSKYGEQGVNEYEQRIAFLNKPGTRKKYQYLLTTEDDIPSDFLNRDLSDSQYIARKAKEILQEITRTVIVTTGSITARLREDWGLVDVLKELNWEKYSKQGLTETYTNKEGHQIRIIKDWTKRNDHRHHAMDALTIAFTCRQHINYLNALNAHQSGKLPASVFSIGSKNIKENGKFIAPMPNMRQEAIKHMKRILVSIKAKNKVVTRSVNKIKHHGKVEIQHTFTPRHQLHNETVYGIRMSKEYKFEKVGSAFTAEKIATVTDRAQRKALLYRLTEFGGDAKKAFTGKNAFDKNPLFTDAPQCQPVPAKVQTMTLVPIYTIRKAVDKDLKVDKVIDPVAKSILQKRLEEYGDNALKAFSNLDENPIWLDEKAGIDIKTVRIKGVNVVEPLHEKRDKDGRLMLDANGCSQPVDFVSTGNNHHVAIFEDEKGNWQEHIVSYYEATALINDGLSPIDKEYNRDKGWKFLFTMKQNEYFVFPSEGFNPNEIDLMDESNYSRISPHLFRVQKIATGYYVFRHHLETVVTNDNKKLRKQIWERIRTPNDLKGIVKVRVNHNGRIVAVGEY